MKYNPISGKLNRLDSRQGEQLLGRFCVLPRFQWFLRHHAAIDTLDAVRVRNKEVENWTANVFGVIVGYNWPTGSRRKLELSLRSGGFGRSHMEWLPPAAHVAGWANTAAGLGRLAPSLKGEIWNGLNLVHYGTEASTPAPKA